MHANNFFLLFFVGDRVVSKLWTPRGVFRREATSECGRRVDNFVHSKSSIQAFRRQTVNEPPSRSVSSANTDGGLTTSSTRHPVHSDIGLREHVFACQKFSSRS